MRGTSHEPGQTRDPGGWTAGGGGAGSRHTSRYPTGVCGFRCRRLPGRIGGMPGGHSDGHGPTPDQPGFLKGPCRRTESGPDGPTGPGGVLSGKGIRAQGDHAGVAAGQSPGLSTRRCRIRQGRADSQAFPGRPGSPGHCGLSPTHDPLRGGADPRGQLRRGHPFPSGPWFGP